MAEKLMKLGHGFLAIIVFGIPISAAALLLFVLAVLFWGFFCETWPVSTVVLLVPIIWGVAYHFYERKY